MMSSMRLTIILWVLVLISAIAVVLVSHGSRKAFFEWQGLVDAAQSYDIEWGQLLIEKSTLASYSRLENLARDTLNMSAPSNEQIIVVNAEDTAEQNDVAVADKTVREGEHDK